MQACILLLCVPHSGVSSSFCSSTGKTIFFFPPPLISFLKGAGCFYLSLLYTCSASWLSAAFPGQPGGLVSLKYFFFQWDLVCYTAAFLSWSRGIWREHEPRSLPSLGHYALYDPVTLTDVRILNVSKFVSNYKAFVFVLLSISCSSYGKEVNCFLLYSGNACQTLVCENSIARN